MQHIPNILTFIRLLLIPVFVVLMLDPSPTRNFLAVVIFTFAVFTDFVDGIIARRFGAISDFGKLFDPLADKILVMAALVMLVDQRSDIDGLPWVPGWMVVMVLAREIWVTGLRAVAAGKGIIVAASQAGKIKSFLQMFAIILLLLHDQPLPLPLYISNCQRLGLNLLFISIIVSYWGALEYSAQILLSNSDFIRGKSQTSPAEKQPGS